MKNKIINSLGELKTFSFSDAHRAYYIPVYNDGGWTIRKYATEGYMGNVIAYRCVNEIVRAALDIKITPTLNGAPIDENSNDDVMRLYRQPAPMMDFSDLLREYLTSYLYSGNAYLLAFDGQNGKPKTDIPRRLPAELRVLMPHEVEVKTKQTDTYTLVSYIQRPDATAEGMTYPVNPINNLSRVCHWHSYHPYNPHFGLSPLQAAAYNIEIHNEGSRWNIALLQNSCAPSGAFTADRSLTNDAFSRFSDQLKRFFSGSKNAGKALILEEGMSYTPIGMSPHDMDFISSLDTAARNIASAYGVPFALVLPESSTYNNQHDARVSLYENTVIPILRDGLQSIAAWYSAITGQNYGFDIDLDSISALEEKRHMRFQRMADAVAAGILTPNEAREELGYEYLNESEMGETSSTPEPTPSDDEAEALKRLQAAYEKCRQV